MPTHDEASTFPRDLKKLSPEQRRRFYVALAQFIDDLLEIESGRASEFRRGLRVKPLTDVPGVMEMTWAPNGRATFSVEREIEPGKRHIRWRRCGTHDILRNP